MAVMGLLLDGDSAVWRLEWRGARLSVVWQDGGAVAGRGGEETTLDETRRGDTKTGFTHEEKRLNETR